MAVDPFAPMGPRAKMRCVGGPLHDQTKSVPLDARWMQPLGDGRFLEMFAEPFDGHYLVDSDLGLIFWQKPKRSTGRARQQET